MKLKIKEIITLDLIKIKTFNFSKDTVKKWKGKPRLEENVCRSHISNKGLISRIYKELLFLNIRREKQIKMDKIFK